jgi:hypothetical protein
LALAVSTISQVAPGASKGCNLEASRSKNAARALGNKVSLAKLKKNLTLWRICERWLDTSLPFFHQAFPALLAIRLQNVFKGHLALQPNALRHPLLRNQRQLF